MNERRREIRNFHYFVYLLIVPDGPGKGTINAFNGQKASSYLKRAESLVTHRQPFSWVFIRPPFASSCVCCKACVCHNMKNHCMSPNKVRERERKGEMRWWSSY